MTAGKNIHAGQPHIVEQSRLGSNKFRILIDCLIGTGQGSPLRQRYRSQEIPVIFLRNESCRQPQEQDHRTGGQSHQNAHGHNQLLAQLVQDDSVFFNHLVEAAVEPVEETIQFVLIRFLFAFLQEHRAQCRCQRQCHKSGNQNGHGNGQSELFIQNPHDPAEECHRHKDGSQYGGYADNRALNLFHGNQCGFLRVLAVVPHFIFHGFNNDDGVIDDQPDGQDHGEQRQGIDAEIQNREGSKGPQQRYRDRDHRDQRGPYILQEEIYDDGNQNQGFHEGMNHFFNGGIDEIRIIDDDLCFHARREGLFILCQLRLDRIDGFNGVGIRRQEIPMPAPS